MVLIKYKKNKTKFLVFIIYYIFDIKDICFHI